MINFYFASKSTDYEYIYDPSHKKNPGAGFQKTESGWSKGIKPKTKLKEKKLIRQIDTTSPTNGNTFSIHESQISLEDEIIVVGKDGRKQKKRFGDLSEKDQKSVKDQLKLIGSFSHKGFSDYSSVSLDSFKSNMKLNLEFVEDKEVKLGKNESKSPVKENLDSFKNKLKENFGRIRGRYDVAVKSNAALKALDEYEKTISFTIEEAVKDGSIGDIRESDLDDFLQEDMKRLIYQEIETRRRSMGDHGIRHLVGNAVNTVKILQQLKQGGITSGTTGKDMLLGMICQVNHDIGYTMGVVATDAGSGTFHKTYSGMIASQERDRYENLLGKDAADILVGEFQVYPEDGKTPVRFTKDGAIPYDQAKNLKPTDELFQKSKTKHFKGKYGAIQYHDDADYDWKNNAFRSAVALADCTALFGKDKVQEFFLEDDVAMEEITKMQIIMNAPTSDFDESEKQKAFSGFQKNLLNRIQNLDILPLDKSMLEQQVQELSMEYTVKDVLTRSSGILDGFKYDPQENTVIVNTKYSEDGKILDDMFGNKYARNQWNKMAENDLHLTQIGFDKNGTQEAVYSDEKNKRIRVNIANMGNARIRNTGVARACGNVPSRLKLQKWARLAQSTKKLDKQILEKELKEYERSSKGEIIFGSNWKKIKELLNKGEYQALNNIPLSDKEKAYLMGSFKISRIAFKIANSIIKNERIAMNIFAETIRTFITKYKKAKFQYRTNGELKLFYNDHCWITELNSKNEAQKVIDNFKHYLDDSAELFIKKTNLIWKRIF